MYRDPRIRPLACANAIGTCYSNSCIARIRRFPAPCWEYKMIMRLLHMPALLTTATTVVVSEPTDSVCPAAFRPVPHGLMDEETTLGSAPANSTSQCCALCAARSGCVAWTLDAGVTCWMTAQPVAPHGNNPSGIRVPIPGPAPPPPPAPLPKVPTPRPPLGFQPNIVLFLTDDQDEILGSRNAMPQAARLLAAKGAVASNWFIHTPVCCPSRAEYLTGRMFHRLRINGVNSSYAKPPKVVMGKQGGGCIGEGNGCMCVNSTLVNQDSFPMYLKAAGYTVGMFGKHLNQCPSSMQSGFDRWFANGGGNYVGRGCSFFDNESPTGSTSCAECVNLC